jgi:hypothetical protein
VAKAYWHHSYWYRVEK